MTQNDPFSTKISLSASPLACCYLVAHPVGEDVPMDHLTGSKHAPFSTVSLLEDSEKSGQFQFLKKGTMGEESLFREDSAALERNGWVRGLAPLRPESLFEGMNIGAWMQPFPQMRSTGRMFCA